MAETSEPSAEQLEELLSSSLLKLSQIQGGARLKPRVQWNPRMRSAAGRAFWPECRVDLNPSLLEFGLDEVRRTLLHELAHLLAYARAGRRRIAPHGAEWQQACADLGIPGERATHRLPMQRNQQRKKWVYVCPQCDLQVLRVRQIKRRVACAHCCKVHNGGRFSQKFVLRESRI